MQRPPQTWLIAYRLVGVRLPDEYRAWLAHDIAAKNFVNWRITRTLLALVTLVGLFLLAQWQLWHVPDRTMVLKLLGVVGAIALLGSRKSYMRRARTWQRIDARGNPVPPKGLGLLDNVGATVLGVGVLVVFTAAASLYAVAQRPPGCKAPPSGTLSQISAGLKNPQTQLEHAFAVTSGGSTFVSASARVPGEERIRIGYWVLEGGQIYDLLKIEGSKGPDLSLTTFDRPPNKDRVFNDAVLRIATCLQDAIRQ